MIGKAAPVDPLVPVGPRFRKPRYCVVIGRRWRAVAPSEGAERLLPGAQAGFSATGYCPGFYPNQYYNGIGALEHPGAGMPISRVSDNLMPVPATDPRGIAAPLAVPLSLRGINQIRQPATLVVWPSTGQVGLYE